MKDALQSGQILARGISRLLAGYDFATLQEFVPTRGLRTDVIALGPARGNWKSEIWIIECKSSRADFLTDQKWQGYLPWCDRYFWAVDGDFPVDLLPDDNGLIIADGYGGEIIRMAPESRLSAPRRKAITTQFARAAAKRLQALRDPRP